MTVVVSPMHHKIFTYSDIVSYLSLYDVVIFNVWQIIGINSYMKIAYPLCTANNIAVLQIFGIPDHELITTFSIRKENYDLGVVFDSIDPDLIFVDISYEQVRKDIKMLRDMEKI